jgi:uncharacterized repeat protein (TIGR03803 family)
MRGSNLGKMTCIVAVLCVATSVASSAQAFKTLLSFNGTNGGQPSSALVQGLDGNLFGVIGTYGKNGYGMVFEVTPEGKLTDIYDFCSQPNCADGAVPTGPLLLAGDGNFYGSTGGGGTAGDGTVFRLTPAGRITTIYSFCSQAGCADGSYPSALAQGRNGNFYGTTGAGGTGAYCPYLTCGTIFEVTANGELTTLHNFCSQPSCSDGYTPSALTVGSDGNLYGTTGLGGDGRLDGTFFALNESGKFVTLQEFDYGEDGSVPNGVIQGSNGNFYGTTKIGGNRGDGAIFQGTKEGVLNAIYSFCTLSECADGDSPEGGLALGSDGNFYGTTLSGGTSTHVNCELADCGTAFEVTATGQLTTLYDFCSQSGCSDGDSPIAPVVQRTDGTFFGTTSEGANTNCFRGCGTIFSLSTGLAPFVAANPPFGKLGYKIIILGNNLTGTTSVTFNGTPAAFSVVSDTYLKATVPTGATTGTIQVTTPSGTLNSNVLFQVLP